MSEPKAQEANPGADAVCILTRTEVYEEYLTLRPIEAMQGAHDVVIQSRLASARTPRLLHTRYRAGLGLEELARLHKYLGEYLARHESQLAQASSEEAA